jgi:integrase
VDITVRLPSGELFRERRVAPVSGRANARRWGEERARHLALHGPLIKKEVPTLEEFKPRFMKNHCQANRHKPSGIEGKESVFRRTLLPLLGKKKLDRICQEDISRLKREMSSKKPATVNNALTVLSQALKCAVEWGVIGAMPMRIKLLKVQSTVPPFYDFDEYRWLVEAARKIAPKVYLLVLLGGDAGFRRGEVIALEQTDCDVRRGLLSVRRSEWKGAVTETKGMETRVVPMTPRLRAALIENQHLVGERALYSPTMEQVTAKVILKWMTRAQRQARLKATGGFHLLRHTFCSHLAMRGAPAIAIQKLAGHKNLQTTLRYMHLAPGETHRAIQLLEDRGQHETPERHEAERVAQSAPVTADARNDAGHGDILETEAVVLPFSRSSK